MWVIRKSNASTVNYINLQNLYQFRNTITGQVCCLMWWKGYRGCFSLGAFLKNFIFFPLTIVWRILWSFSWFYGHHSCVIQLIFRQILFSLKHFERLGLWEYCYLSVWHLLWYMGALIMEYYMSEAKLVVSQN